MMAGRIKHWINILLAVKKLSAPTDEHFITNALIDGGTGLYK